MMFPGAASDSDSVDKFATGASGHDAQIGKASEMSLHTEFFAVTAPFVPAGGHELGVVRGDVVKVLARKAEGWWYVEVIQQSTLDSDGKANNRLSMRSSSKPKLTSYGGSSRTGIRSVPVLLRSTSVVDGTESESGNSTDLTSKAGTTTALTTLADADDEDEVVLAVVDDNNGKDDDDAESLKGSSDDDDDDDDEVDEMDGDLVQEREVEGGNAASAQLTAHPLRVGMRGYVPAAYLVPTVNPRASKPPSVEPGDMLLVLYAYNGGAAAAATSSQPSARPIMSSPLYHVLVPETSVRGAVLSSGGDAGAHAPSILNLEPGESIVLLFKDVGVWWFGERAKTGEKGWFPWWHMTNTSPLDGPAARPRQASVIVPHPPATKPPTKAAPQLPTIPSRLSSGLGGEDNSSVRSDDTQGEEVACLGVSCFFF